MSNPRRCSTLSVVLISLVLTALYPLLPSQAANSAEARSLFKKPGRQYSTGPLWVWNDMLTEEEIRSTLRDLSGEHVRQVWVHPRPGLMTPYLSDEWFKLWDITLREAKRLDMNVWIYDENSYPSGFAGGLVPEAMPESRGRGLYVRLASAAPKWSEDLVAVYRIVGGSAENVSARVRAGESLPAGYYAVAQQIRAKDSPWNGNRCYVNLLSPGVTEKFLGITLEPYRQRFGDLFGKRIMGVFTDEPELKPAQALPWSEDLPAIFKQRWGYDLLDHLPSLSGPIGDWQRVRHNYYQVLNDEFVERWSKPYHDYCETNHLQFTGHYWDHEWPDCTGVPDNMAMYAWHQRPAIDTLMNQYSEHTHAQFGNVRMCRELQSVANQLGMKRTLCEVYGAGGWDLRFEDMKRIGDWLEVLGINTLNQHLSYITIRGARKRDHPQSFSYHEPWWDAYHVSADYFARLSAALSQGQQINRVLVLEPTTTAWMQQGDDAKLRPLGDSFFKLLQDLEAAQVEYDIGSEDLIARFGSVVPAKEDPLVIPAGPVTIKMNRGAELKIGLRAYSTIVLPPLTSNLNSGTVELLEQFLSAQPAGEVLSAAESPLRVDGAESDRIAKLQGLSSWKRIAADEIANTLAQPPYSANPGIRRQAGDKGILFHHRRVFDDGELLFLVNTSIEAASAGTVESSLAGVERWDPYTGAIESYPFRQGADAISATFQLPPSGSLLLFLSRRPLKPARMPSESVTTLEPSAPPQIRRLSPNVLTLDYVDVTAGGETKTSTYFYQANQFTWKANGMERNPWDSAVQFKDELISKKFPAESGFAVSYTFTIDGPVPDDLAIVIERPDLYSVTCNETPIFAQADAWWLDKAFGRIPIAQCAHSGVNTIRMRASPFTVFHELEPVYVLGSFSARPAAKGFVIEPERPLELGTLTNLVTHVTDPAGTMWSTVGVGFEREPWGEFAADRAPFLVFDLGLTVELSGLRIWNYNENQTVDMTGRGVKSMRVTGSPTNGAAPFSIPLGTLQIPRAPGTDCSYDELPLRSPPVRFIRFDILSNHNGVAYPTQGMPADHGLVGMAEVRFLVDGKPLENVRVVRVSSDLRSHRRLAVHLVDGNGLMRINSGWNRQGLPFYAGGVAYTEHFQVDQRGGRFSVSLPSWYGSVASVKVNGKEAGYIDAPPWQRDVTRWIRSGRNEIEVTVIGTLKNTLGPHHGGAAPGAAWPWAFQKAPEFGPPPGATYNTLAYGLFAPFVLKRTVTD